MDALGEFGLAYHGNEGGDAGLRYWRVCICRGVRELPVRLNHGAFESKALIC